MIAKVSGVLVAFTYPAYSSYLALRRGDGNATRRWLLYWTVLGAIRGGEVVADTFLSWFPLYEEAKLAFYVWLVFPGLSGFVYLFRRHLNPLLIQNQDRISASVDHMVDLSQRTIGIPGAGVSRLAELCRSAGIPVGSSDGETTAFEDVRKGQ